MREVPVPLQPLRDRERVHRVRASGLLDTHRKRGEQNPRRFVGREKNVVCFPLRLWGVSLAFRFIHLCCRVALQFGFLCSVCFPWLSLGRASLCLDGLPWTKLWVGHLWTMGILRMTSFCRIRSKNVDPGLINPCLLIGGCSPAKVV